MRASSAPLSSRERGRGEGAPPTIILLPDCFTMYNEPRIGRAAVRVLEELGYRTVLPGLGCCGRSLISVGLLGKAAAVCRSTASALLKAVDEVEPVAVVGAEPSCISAIKDEWLELEMGVDVDLLRGLADRTFLVEEFIDRRWDSHPTPFRPAASMQPFEVLLHGHCHQKALWGIETSSNALQRVLGTDRVRALDSGCCGMAGSFGYAAKRFDLSMAIGELSLFEPIRGAPPETAVVAPGTSCRHQILDGTGVHAIHPIEAIAMMMGVGEDERVTG